MRTKRTKEKSVKCEILVEIVCTRIPRFLIQINKTCRLLDFEGMYLMSILPYNFELILVELCIYSIA